MQTLNNPYVAVGVMIGWVCLVLISIRFGVFERLSRLRLMLAGHFAFWGMALCVVYVMLIFMLKTHRGDKYKREQG